MRILFLTNIFPSPEHLLKGTFNLEMVKGLAEQHDIAVVCPVSWLDSRRRSHSEALAAAATETKHVATHFPRYYYTPKMCRRFYGSFMWWSLRSTLDRIVRDNPPDIVLSYWAHPDGAVALRLARSLGVPGVVMVGGSDVLLFTRNRTRRRLILRALDAADGVITVSEDLKTRIVGHGIAADKVTVVPRGVNLERFRPGDRLEARRRLGVSADTTAILWVGRMVPVKGLDVLVSACALLKHCQVDFRLFLLGTGPEQKKLQKQVERNQLENCVSFVGPVLHGELPDWYRAADLTVLPSHSEGTPNVLLESIACGTPFVGSDVGGVPAIATPGLDRLVPPGNEEALADAIAECLRRPRNQIGEQRRFSPISQGASAYRVSSVLNTLMRREPVSVTASYVPLVGS